MDGNPKWCMSTIHCTEQSGVMCKHCALRNSLILVGGQHEKELTLYKEIKINVQFNNEEDILKKINYHFPTWQIKDI